jgi:hypothetical protein
MNFFVVEVGEAMQSAQLSQAILKRVQIPKPGPHPIILVCDFSVDYLPGFENQYVYLLNDAAWIECRDLNLKATKTIDDSELPERYILLAGPNSANAAIRQFEH